MSQTLVLHEKQRKGAESHERYQGNDLGDRIEVQKPSLINFPKQNFNSPP